MYGKLRTKTDSIRNGLITAGLEAVQNAVEITAKDPDPFAYLRIL